MIALIQENQWRAFGLGGGGVAGRMVTPSHPRRKSRGRFSGGRKNRKRAKKKNAKSTASERWVLKRGRLGKQSHNRIKTSRIREGEIMEGGSREGVRRHSYYTNERRGKRKTCMSVDRNEGGLRGGEGEGSVSPRHKCGLSATKKGRRRGLYAERE